tara:strand:- start:16 stop:273 length:258 start_codon:yes stop_codon:yes gene_type:complete
MSDSRRNNTLEFSHQGGIVIDDTTATTGQFGAIQVINDAVFSAITAPEYTNATDLTTLTISAGTVLYGRITAFTLTSGVVIAHNY